MAEKGESQFCDQRVEVKAAEKAVGLPASDAGLERSETYGTARPMRIL